MPAAANKYYKLWVRNNANTGYVELSTFSHLQFSDGINIVPYANMVVYEADKVKTRLLDADRVIKLTKHDSTNGLNGTTIFLGKISEAEGDQKTAGASGTPIVWTIRALGFAEDLRSILYDSDSTVSGTVSEVITSIVGTINDRAGETLVHVGTLPSTPTISVRFKNQAILDILYDLSQVGNGSYIYFIRCTPYDEANGDFTPVIHLMPSDHADYNTGDPFLARPSSLKYWYKLDEATGTTLADSIGNATASYVGMGKNLVKNADFRDGETNWNRHEVSVGATLEVSNGSYSQPAPYAKGDSFGKMAHFLAPSDGTNRSATYKQDIEVIAGQTYTRSIHIKGQNIVQGPNGWNKFYVFGRWLDSAGTEIGNCDIDLGAGTFDWKRVTSTVTAPTGAYKMRLIWGLSTCQGEAWASAFQVEHGGAATPFVPHHHAHATYWWKDDFESYTVGTRPDIYGLNYHSASGDTTPTLTVTDERAYSGTKSLKVVTQSVNGSHVGDGVYLAWNRINARQLGTTYRIRAKVFLESGALRVLDESTGEQVILSSLNKWHIVDFTSTENGSDFTGAIVFYATNNEPTVYYIDEFEVLEASSTMYDAHHQGSTADAHHSGSRGHGGAWFDSKHGVVSITSNAASVRSTLAGDRTVETWVFPTQFKNSVMFTTKNCGVAGEGGWFVGINSSGKPIMGFNAGTTGEVDTIVTCTDQTLELNKWNHVMWDYDAVSQDVTFRVNNKDGAADRLGIAHAQGNVSYIGGEDGGSPSSHGGHEWGFKGIIDEVRFYNGLLSAQVKKRRYHDGQEDHDDDRVVHESTEARFAYLINEAARVKNAIKVQYGGQGQGTDTTYTDYVTDADSIANFSRREVLIPTPWAQEDTGRTITGTAAVTNASATVTGTGTSFTTQFVVGDPIKFENDTVLYHVAAINSNTSLTLNRPYEGGTTSGLSIISARSTAALKTAQTLLNVLKGVDGEGIQRVEVTLRSSELKSAYFRGSLGDIIGMHFANNTLVKGRFLFYEYEQMRDRLTITVGLPRFQHLEVLNELKKQFRSTSGTITIPDLDKRFINVSGDSMDGSLTLKSGAIAGGDIVGETTFAIRQGTNNGADNRSVTVAGGGDASPDRGASLKLHGTQNNSGNAILEAGSETAGAGGSVAIRAGQSDRLTVDPSGSVNVPGSLSVGSLSTSGSAAAGNTNITGTLDVSGATTLSSTLSVGSTLSLPGYGTNRIPFINGSNALASTAALTWDSNRNLLGLGTSAPAHPLHLNTDKWMHGAHIPGNRSLSGANNILFNATNRYTVTQTGSATLDLPTLFNGKMEPSYSSVGPTDADPTVITISGLPSVHVQASSFVSLSTRYWFPDRFKLEGYDETNLAWTTFVDYSTTDYPDAAHNMYVRALPSGRYTSLRLTVYRGTGTADGSGNKRFGLSEIMFLHGEAHRLYSGLLPNNLWEGAQGRVGIGTANPEAAFHANVNHVLQTGTNSHQILASGATFLSSLRGLAVDMAANTAWDLLTLKNDAGTQLLVDGTGKLTWRGDTNLYRSAANVLKTDDSLIVGGDLTVHGTTTTVNSTDLSVSDNIIRLNKDETGAGVALGTAGLEIERGTLTDARLVFDESDDSWKVSYDGGTTLSQLVELGRSQTLTNKTLTNPTINDGALSGTFSGNHTYTGLLTLRRTEGASGTPSTVFQIANDTPTGDPNQFEVQFELGNLHLKNPRGNMNLATSGNVPTANGIDLVTVSGTQTLTNKTIGAATLTGETVSTGNIRLSSATPSLIWDSTADTGYEWSMVPGTATYDAATRDTLEVREPEEADKWQLRIVDDVGIDARYGYWMDGTRILDASRNMSNIATLDTGAITTSGLLTLTRNIADASGVTTAVFQKNVTESSAKYGLILHVSTDERIILAPRVNNVDKWDREFYFHPTDDRWVFKTHPYVATNRILTTADMGAGNALDADTLDAQDGSYYLDLANHTGTLAISQGGTGRSTGYSTNGIIFYSTANGGQLSSLAPTGAGLFPRSTSANNWSWDTLASGDVTGALGYTPAKVETVSFTVAASATGWYRIARNGSVADAGTDGSRANGLFTVRDVASGRHSSTTFHANVHYGNNPTLTMVNRGWYSAHGIVKKIRLVEGDTYEGAAVEVYVENTANANTVYVELHNDYHASGWEMVSGTAGEVPLGFATTQLDLDTYDPVMAISANGNHNAFYITRTGGAKFGDGITVGGTVAATALTVTSDTVVTNLNADRLDGLHKEDFALAGHNHDSAYVNVGGDSMTGSLTFNNNTGVYVKNVAGTALHVASVNASDAVVLGATTAALNLHSNATPVWNNGTTTYNLWADNNVTAGNGISISGQTITNTGIHSVAVSGTGLSVSTASNVATVSSNATSANTASTIVARDASGNFTAGTITAALSGNASTASKWAAAMTLSLTGSVTGSASIDGSGNVSLATTTNHNHDDLYVKLTGSTLTGLLTFAAGQDIAADATSGGTVTQGIRFQADSDTFDIFMRTDNVGEKSGLIVQLADNGDDYFQIEQESPGGETTPVVLFKLSETLGAKFETSLTASSVSASTFTSTVAAGTAPFTVTSDTKVDNLNADKLDGYDSGNFPRKAEAATITEQWTFRNGIVHDTDSFVPLYVREYNDASFHRGQLSLGHARGTKAAPTAVLSGDLLGRVSFEGNNGAGWSADAATIDVVAAENFSGTAEGTRMVFSVTPAGTTSQVARLTIAPDGTLYAGASGTNALWHEGNLTPSDYLNRSTGGVVSGDIELRGDTGYTPALLFNSNYATGTTPDTGVDWGVRANGDSLEFYEPEETNKVQVKFVDDVGVDALYGYLVNGTRIIDGSRNMTNIASLHLTGPLYGGISAAKATVWAYNPDYPNHGVFYTEGVTDFVSISPSGGGDTTPDLKIDGAGVVTARTRVDAPTFTSTVASGTAPFTVTSGTKVTNLNVDKLDDLDSTDFLRRNTATDTNSKLLFTVHTVGPQFTHIASADTPTFMTSGNYITGGSDYAGLSKINNIAVQTWYGFSVSPTIASQTVPQGTPAFSVNARTGVTYGYTRFEAPTFTSTVANGTAPFSVASNTKVTNLNADLLDGMEPVSTNTASSIVARDASGNFAAGAVTFGGLTVNAVDSVEGGEIKLKGGGTNPDWHLDVRDTRVRFHAGGEHFSVNTSGLTTVNTLDISGYVNRIGPTTANADRGRWNPFWTLMGTGVSMFPDEDFSTGSNSVSVYNNASGDGLNGVVHTRTNATITIDTRTVEVPNKSGYYIKITNNGTGATSPGRGGFVQLYSHVANKVIVHRFRALVPVGKYLSYHHNSPGTNYSKYWLTDTAGTGKWEEYAYVTVCGDSGTFSSGGHVAVNDGTNTAAAFDWYVASCSAYEVEESLVNFFTGKAQNETVTGNWTISGDWTFTANPIVSKTNPVFIMKDTDGTTSNLLSYVSFRDSTTERGWVGYGENSSQMRVKNAIGTLELTGSAVTINGSTAWHEGNQPVASTNTASTLVKRDASGNFSAGTISAALSGNATTATTLQTARNINGKSFNGSANIDIDWLRVIDNGSDATVGRTIDRATDHFSKQVLAEFKVRSNIGAPGSDTYAALLTVAGYSDASSGPTHGQFSISGQTLGFRSGQYGSAWNSWREVMFKDSAQDLYVNTSGDTMDGALIVNKTGDYHLQLKRPKTETAGGKFVMFELFQDDVSTPAVPEVYPSIRFHHAHRYWKRIEARSEGLYIKDGNISVDTLASLYAGAGDFTSLKSTGNVVLEQNATPAEGGALNSTDLVLRGYYDSNSAAGVTKTNSDYTLRNTVATDGAQTLKFYAGAIETAALDNGGNLVLPGIVTADWLKATTVYGTMRDTDGSELRIGGGSGFSFVTDGIKGAGIRMYGRNHSTGGTLDLFAYDGAEIKLEHLSANGGRTNRLTINSSGNAYFRQASVHQGGLIAESTGTPANGSSINSTDIILRGWYDSDATATVTKTASEYKLRNVVASNGAQTLKFYAGSTETASLTNSGNLTVTTLTTTNLSGAQLTGRLAQSSSGFHANTKDDLTTRTDSGFFQTASATTAEGWPETTNNWYHLLNSTHTNDSNYYSMQLAADFFNQKLWYRSTDNVGTTAWNEVHHDGMYISQLKVKGLAMIGRDGQGAAFTYASSASSDADGAWQSGDLIQIIEDTVTTKLRYDSANGYRLMKTITVVGGSITETLTYTYDGSGNMTGYTRSVA